MNADNSKNNSYYISVLTIFFYDRIYVNYTSTDYKEIDKYLICKNEDKNCFTSIEMTEVVDAVVQSSDWF